MSEEPVQSTTDNQTTDAATAPEKNAIDLISGPIDHNTIREFRNSAFRSLREIERLRDWCESPMAGGAFWARCV